MFFVLSKNWAKVEISLRERFSLAEIFFSPVDFEENEEEKEFCSVIRLFRACYIITLSSKAYHSFFKKNNNIRHRQQDVCTYQSVCRHFTTKHYLRPARHYYFVNDFSDDGKQKWNSSPPPKTYQGLHRLRNILRK